MSTRFLADADGATATEYALLAGGIALAIVAAVGLMGEELAALFGDLSVGLSSLL